MISNAAAAEIVPEDFYPLHLCFSFVRTLYVFFCFTFAACCFGWLCFSRSCHLLTMDFFYNRPFCAFCCSIHSPIAVLFTAVWCFSFFLICALALFILTFCPHSMRSFSFFSVRTLFFSINTKPKKPPKTGYKRCKQIKPVSSCLLSHGYFEREAFASQIMHKFTNFRLSFHIFSIFNGWSIHLQCEWIKWKM